MSKLRAVHGALLGPGAERRELSFDLGVRVIWQMARAFDLAGRGGQMDRQSGHPGRTKLWVVELDHGPELASVLGGDPFAYRPGPADGCSSLVAKLLPLTGRPRQEQ